MTGIDSGLRFPGESDAYRRERIRLLEAEIGLRRAIEEVAAQRRALPPGGAVPEDYRFEEVSDGGGEVRFSELFAPRKDTLVIYSFMFPRYWADTRSGPGGETGRLRPAETPCPSCTSILDSLDGAAPHLAQRINLAVVAKSSPERISTFAHERGWRHLRLLSSRNNNYNRDYHARRLAIADHERVHPRRERDPAPVGDRADIRSPRRGRGPSPRRLDLAGWNVLDTTPQGRGTEQDFPGVDYS
jgi:predicted dithiol-disulfide oxidoreductase (DUF899 family)